MEQTILIICGVVTLFWAAITGRVILAQKRIRWLSPSSDAVRETQTVSVVIPARNEEQDIGASLRSVLSQVGVRLEVVLIDDHSTDRTGAIADEIAASDPRVRVLHEPPLKQGWLGKCNAMQFGAAEATGEYLLFTDADILHRPECCATALAEMQRGRYDFISLFPLFDNRSFWENVNVPIYFFGVGKLLATPGLEDPHSPDAAASGALMLMKREVFWSIGGFEKVKHEMFDDMAFARAVKRKGYRVGYRLAPAYLRVRLFKSGHDAFWGTTKNILTAVEGRAGLGILLIILGILQNGTPLFAMATGVAKSSRGLFLAGLAAYAMQYLSFFSVRRLLRFRPLMLLFYPLSAVVATCCILRALVYFRKGAILWRGRKMAVRNTG